MKPSIQLLVLSALFTAAYAELTETSWREELCHACNGTVLYTNDTFFCVMETKEEMACVNWEVASLKGVDLRPLILDGSDGPTVHTNGRRTPRNGDSQDFQRNSAPNYEALNPARDMRRMLENMRERTGVVNPSAIRTMNGDRIEQAPLPIDSLFNDPRMMPENRRGDIVSDLQYNLPKKIGHQLDKDTWDSRSHSSPHRTYEDLERNGQWADPRRIPWGNQVVQKPIGREAGLHEVRLGGPLGGEGFQARTQYSRGDNPWNPWNPWSLSPDSHPNHDTFRQHDGYRVPEEQRFNSRYFAERPAGPYQSLQRGYNNRDDSRAYHEQQPSAHKTCVDNVLHFLTERGLLEDEKRKQAARALLEREDPETAAILAQTLQQHQQPETEDSPRMMPPPVMPADASNIAEQIAASVARAAERLFPLPDSRNEMNRLQSSKISERARQEVSQTVKQTPSDNRQTPDIAKQKRHNEPEPTRPLDAPEYPADIYSVGPMFTPNIHHFLRLPSLTT